MKLRSQKQLGFTLIEMMVSLGLFSIVITITVGALLVLIATNQQLQAEQSVMTNLSFAIDSMTREIRTGTHYFCAFTNNTSAHTGIPGFPGSVDNIFNNNTDLDIALFHVSNDAHIVKDCDEGNKTDKSFIGVAFREGGNSLSGLADERILYYFDKNENKIFRRVGDGEGQSIVSSGIYLEHVDFYVTGSLTGANGTQPAVTIFIRAKEKASADKVYEIQTTITQRTFDI